MKRIALVNPNTNAVTTALMVAIARQHAVPGCEVEGVTAPSGAALIVNEDQLRMAADGVTSMARSFAKQVDGVIVSAFGDPGVEALRKQLSMPVEGIAEPAMREAAARGRRFAIVSTTPGLVRHMLASAHRLGFGPQLAAVRTTEVPLEPLMRDSERLVDALEYAARLAIDEDAAQAIIVGGGPLAAVAQSLRHRLSVEVVEPIPAAMRRMTSILLQSY
jgi:allantoin racemase